MTQYQRLFLLQAQTDFVVFELLRRNSALPACHALHYLQMATELLGKAHAWKHGKPTGTHRAFVGFLRSLSTNRRAQQELGFDSRTENWRQMIRKGVILAGRIEDLAPALSPDSPNPEYPWPRVAPHTAPAEHAFDIWQELKDSAGGRKFLRLIGDLFRTAEQFI